MRLILAILMMATLCFGKTYSQQLKELTPAQQEVMVNSLKAGKFLKNKEHGILLAAIAWKESNFGIDKLNSTDGKKGSWGSHQILLDSALKRLESLEKIIGENGIALLLYYSDYFSAVMANKELKYWNKVHKGDITKVLASYNAGGASTKSERGRKYSKDVQYRMTLIASYVDKNGIKF